MHQSHAAHHERDDAASGSTSKENLMPEMLLDRRGNAFVPKGYLTNW